MHNSRLRYRTDFLSEHFAISPVMLGSLRTDTALYLKSAKIVIDGFATGSSVPLVAQLAHFSQTTLVRVVTPPVQVTWHRGENSRSRALVLIARQGAFTMSDGVTAVVRGTGAAIIVPGTGDVQIRTTSPMAEVIYLSIPADKLASPLTSLRQRIDLPPVDWTPLAPLYAFIRAMVEPDPIGSRDPRAELSTVVDEVSRAVVSMLCVDLVDHTVDEERSLVQRARGQVLKHYANPALTSASVARALGVSPRSLQSAFSAVGTTFTRELRARRIAALHELEAEQHGARRAELWEPAGFSSISAMYRAVRAEQLEFESETQY